MCNLYLAYEEHFGDMMRKLLEVEKNNVLKDDDLFSEMMMSKASAYDIRNTDVMIYALFTFMNPQNSLGNYIKFPQNKILFEKMISNTNLMHKKIAEVFEVKLVDNKAMSKKVKNSFDHYMLTNLENKLFMCLEIVDFFKKKPNFNLEKRFVDLIDENNTPAVALHYVLSYIISEEEERKKLKQHIEERGELFKQKIKFHIEMYYSFAIDILKLAKPERYELFVDEQLVQITDHIKIEKEALLNSFISDEQKYLQMIDDLTMRLNQLEKENMELKNTSMKKTSPLNNKKVLVVGDTGRKDSYRQIVEQYGGNFDFVDGIFEKEKISTLSESADVAILVVPRIKHTVSNILKANKVPVIFVNSAGIGSFEEVVDNYCAG